MKVLSEFFFFTFFMMIKNKNAGIPECRRKGQSGIVIFTVSPHHQSGIGIPALTSVRYRWSRIIPVVRSYAKELTLRIPGIGNEHSVYILYTALLTGYQIGIQLTSDFIV
jgi:hypothetical protein